jgi:hypothetical protein
MESFAARLDPLLERNGIRGGPARVRLDRDVLVIEGAISGRLAIPAGRVARLRLCVQAGKIGTYYSARIRRTGESGGEIVLAPGVAPGAYGAVMRGFARRVAEAGGPGRIEAGRSRIMAWVFYPACVLLLAWLTFALARHAIQTRATGDWLAAGLFAALLALFLPAAFGIRIRTAASLKEIDALLPLD